MWCGWIALDDGDGAEIKMLYDNVFIGDLFILTGQYCCPHLTLLIDYVMCMYIQFSIQ